MISEGERVGSLESTVPILKSVHACPNKIKIPLQSFPLATFPPLST